MFTEQTARELKDSCVRFHTADAELRAGSVSGTLIPAAEEYLEAHEKHSEMIDKAKKELI